MSPPKITELRGLLIRLEEASEPDRNIDMRLWIVLDLAGEGVMNGFGAPAFTASLDLAVQMLKQTLPTGVGWGVTEHSDEPPFTAAIALPNTTGFHQPILGDGKGAALALCAATVRAKLAETRS